MTIILKLICWIPVIAVFVAVDRYLIKIRKTSPNHLVGFILRGGAAILYGALIFEAQPGWHGVHVLSFEALSFWLLFEHSLNIWLGRPVASLGQTAATDRFFSRNRGLYYILKALALGVCVANIICLLKYD